MTGRNVLGVPLVRLAPWIVLILGLSTTAVLYGSIYRALEKRNREQFGQEIDRLTLQTDAAVRAQVSVLNATAGAMAAAPHMTRKDFAAYYERLSRGSAAQMPAVLGVSLWQPWTRRDALIRDAAARGVTGFRLRPAEPRPEAHAIVLLEPLQGRNLEMPGFDMRSEPTRRAAMDEARDTGEAVMTEQVILVQDQDRPQPSFILYLPLYDGALPAHPSVEERRAHLVGFVYAGLHAETLFGSLAEHLDTDKVGLRIWSTEPKVGHPVYEHGVPEKAMLSQTVPIRFSDVTGDVTAEFTAQEGFGTAPVIRRYVIPVGSALSLLLFMLATVMRSSYESSRRRETEQALLAETGRLVARGADNDSILREIAAHIADALNAVCRIDLLEPEGKLRTVTTRVERREALAELERSFPRLENDQLLQAAITTGETQRTVGYPALDEAHRARIEALEVGPVLVVPLWLGEHALGAITAVRSKGSAPFSSDAASLAEAIAGRMALAIDNVRLYRDLERRVDERTRDLEASNHELESFCYSVSHDLRTPLRSLDGFSRALQEDYGDRLDAEGMDFIERIRASAKRMDELITALLTLSRLTRREIVPTEVDVNSMVRDQMHDLDPNGLIRLQIEEGLRVHADTRMMAVVLDNLLSNAVKFSSRTENPSVTVGKTAEGELFVRDNGAGFDMAYAAKLFQPFERLHSVREFPGHGIGLATVERIVRRHGGEVRAEGRPGEGATFFMRFPG